MPKIQFTEEFRQVAIRQINAVAESFFQLLKRERIRRRTFDTRNQAREEVFDYIEVFYNRKRRHSFTNGMSPVDFENQFFTRPTSV